MNNNFIITFEKENNKKLCDIKNIDCGLDFYTPIPQEVNSYINYHEIYKDVDSSLGEIDNG